MPFFAAWFAAETKDPELALGLALKVRDEPEFVDARYQLMRVRDAFDDDDFAAAHKKAAKLLAQVDAALGQMKRKFGVKGAGGEISMSSVATVYNPVANMASWPKLPSLAVSVPLPDFIERAIPRRGFALAYRNVAAQLPQIWKLGDVRRLLSSRVRKSDKAAYAPKVENPRFRNVHSHWKSPM